MKFYQKLASILTLSALLMGCTTLNPVTNQQEYSHERTEALKAAVQGPVTTTLTIVLVKNKGDEDLANYFRSVGGVFCQVKTNKSFDPSYVVSEVAKIVIPNIKDDNTRIIAMVVKDSLLSLYKAFYSYKINIPALEQSYLYNISDVSCQSIDTALRNAGKPGI